MIINNSKRLYLHHIQLVAYDTAGPSGNVRYAVGMEIINTDNTNFDLTSLFAWFKKKAGSTGYTLMYKTGVFMNTAQTKHYIPTEVFVSFSGDTPSISGSGYCLEDAAWSSFMAFDTTCLNSAYARVDDHIDPLEE